LGADVLIEVTLLVLSIVLVLLAVTGYDRYIALKVRARILKELTRGGVGEDIGNDLPSLVKRVKVARVGSYLVITLVLREGDDVSEEKIEVSDPTLLTPLMMDEEVIATS